MPVFSQTITTAAPEAAAEATIAIETMRKEDIADNMLLSTDKCS